MSDDDRNNKYNISLYTDLFVQQISSDFYSLETHMFSIYRMNSRIYGDYIIAIYDKGTDIFYLLDKDNHSPDISANAKRMLTNSLRYIDYIVKWVFPNIPGRKLKNKSVSMVRLGYTDFNDLLRIFSANIGYKKCR